MIREIIEHSLEEARIELERFLCAPQTASCIEQMVDVMAHCLKTGGKIMSCGNGGSLCDATHFAEELTGRFRASRRPLPAMAINDPAYLSCTANDFSYEEVFSRWVEAFGREGDVLLSISTSGSSENVIKAASKAKALGMKVIALTCEGPSPLAELADVCIGAPKAPHSDRIQEIHIKVIHIAIEALEAEMDL